MIQRAQILSAGIKPGDSYISIWALCMPKAASERRQVRIIGTGHPITANMSGYDFVSTVIHQVGSSVLCWHVFVEVSNAA